MSTAYIGLGSNLQQPAQQLQQARAALAALPRTRLLASSSLYRSRAIGPGAQPDYLNAVASLDTRLQPTELLQALQAIERQQGRVRGERWGARTLDLDILLYGDLQLDSEHLTIPHPAMRERPFVLYPLAELDPALVLPCGTPIGTLLATCPLDGLVDTGQPLDTSDRATGR